MKFKGTKGKWLLKETENKFAKGQFSYEVIVENGGIISIVSDGETPENRNEFNYSLLKANALLISKAPEMLQQLIDLRNAVLSEDFVRILAESQKTKELIKEATEL